MNIALYYPKGIENIFHKSADGLRVYKLDFIEKVDGIREMLAMNSSLFINYVDSPQKDILALVHSEEYIDALKTGSPNDLSNSSGFLWQPGFFEVNVNSAWSIIEACKTAMLNQRSGAITHGGHHAVRNRGYGFNPINEISIACKFLLKNKLAFKIAILDLDVHYGNGNAELLANVPDILLVDIFSKRLPQWGITKASNIIEHEVQTRDNYLVEIDKSIKEIIKFSPDLIIYHSGADVIQTDRLGGIPNFTELDFKHREEKVINSFKKAKIPLAVCLGGGYINRNGESHDINLKKLIDLHCYSYDCLVKN